MKSLEELAQEAKDAQRAYDTAVHSIKRAKVVPTAKVAEDDTIIATSTLKGFKFDCNAKGDLVVKHTVATMYDALSILYNQKDLGNLMLLVVGIMEEVKALQDSKL